MLSLLDNIESAARAHPDNIAIRLRTSTLSYRQLTAQIDAVAKHALAHGAQPGDRFLYAARPSPESLAITLGMLRAGLTLVFVDPFSAPALFHSRAQLVQPRFTLADSILYTLGDRRLAAVRRWRNVQVSDYSAVSATPLYIGRKLPGVPKSAVSASAWTSGAPDVDLVRVDPNADAVITFTSGTTSDPKGVVHSLASLTANAAQFAALLDISPGQKVYSEPMTVGSVALARGAEWHIPHRKDVVPDADLYFAVPTEILTLLERVQRMPRKPAIHRVATGAAPVLPSLVRRIDAVLHPSEITNVYGMTEMLPVATCDARRKADTEGGDLLGTPIGDTEVMIADDQEILVRGPGLMKNYFGHPPAGWHPTGDLGELRDGELVLLGRKKNMLIRGNTNIYPSLYETGIAKIDGVAEAAIVGVPDEYGDDAIVLYVVPEAGRKPGEVRSNVIRDVNRHVDRDALPDIVLEISQLPVTGRAKKRDHAALLERAKPLLSEPGAALVWGDAAHG